MAVLVNNIVGDGIIPRAASEDDPLNRTVDRLWEAWADRAGADGQLDVHGLQTLAARELVKAGEALVRRRSRRPEDGLPVPVQLKVLEAGLLDASRDGAVGGRTLPLRRVGWFPTVATVAAGSSRRPWLGWESARRAFAMSVVRSRSLVPSCPPRLIDG